MDDGAWGHTSPPLQALENAFKAETVGLVTREEFMEKRRTLAERLEHEAAEKKRAAEEAERQARVEPHAQVMN